ncbi:TonB-dependent receptor domain-containing protein [Rhodoferax sp. PAMC 29310]|uniref:TonB-dependent receptor domain-containing protein n=1 Tax=Rhodoferax sp. PAMC 29310 TaxID=2822760 RepID=UPI001B343935|nr:TonB-dependent receptor [Rhodoferax sp. PAMC 29310]
MKFTSSCARLAALPLALAAAFPSFAQAQLTPVIVTATRVAQPITDVVADVTLIDRATIERSGAGGLADLLVRTPGIAMTRNGGPGATTSLYVRGAESRFTAVFVDGVRVDSQSTGGASWNAMPLSQIDRIEIVRGPAAAIYGSDAIGGVIQIFTRKGEAGFSPSIEMGAGSHGTYKLALGLSGGTDSVDYALGLAREISTGFNSQPTVNSDLDGYQSNSVSGRLGFKLNAAHRIEATFLSNDLDAQYDGFTKGFDDHSLSRLQAVGLNWTARWSEAYSTRVSIGQGDDHYETKPSVYVTDTSVTSYLWHNEYRSGAHVFSADLERREDKLKNASTTPVVSNRSQDALALGYGLRQGAHTLQLNARHDQDSEFGAVTTGSAAYAYAVTQAWRVTAAMGTAFRAPTLFQRFSQYGVATLTPETARNREVGVKYEAHGDKFGAVVYRNTVSDLITYVAGPGTCANGSGTYAGCYGNTALAQYEGITLTASKRMGGVSFSGSLDLQNPHDATTGKQLARRAKQLATIAADTRISNWNVGAELQATGERFDNAANTKRLAGYSLLNLHVSTSLNREWSLLGRVDNLLDQKYETAQGYATSGQTFYVGLKWSPV